MKTRQRNWINGCLAVIMALGFAPLAVAGHGHPKKHTYYYYPHQNIYYVPAKRCYYVWDHDERHWVASSWGPAVYLTSLTVFPRVELRMESSRPYYYNAVHYREYRKPVRVVVEEPVRPAVVASVGPAREQPNKPRVQINVNLTPVRVEQRPVYVRPHPHHHGHPGKGHGHHKGHGHGHHKKHHRH